MAKSILTPRQIDFLRVFSSNVEIARRFYLTGGTCLSEHYLHHRVSEDLDFFCESEFDPLDLTMWIGGNKNTLALESFEFQQSFNRNMYFLSYAEGNKLKVEFTYYPFRQIEKPKKHKGILIDSLLDIATNKLFTIYQKPRGRDYFDLYMILKKQPSSILNLRIMAQTKFDSSIDLLQLATRLNEVDEKLDDPILLSGSYPRRNVISFFQKESLKLKPQILD